MCFLTSWLVLLWGVPFTFTPWGFVSGLFMVPGGTAGYFAVRSAGLAASQGIWSSLKVLVAFGWGIFVFHEPVRSSVGTATAVVLVMLGLVGMSFFAAPLRVTQDEDYISMSSDQVDKPSSSWWLSNWHLGCIGAVIDGAYGGSVLVPMHYASSANTSGLAYVISFAIGCTTVVIVAWILRFLYCCHVTQSLSQGFESLPSFHLETIGLSAALAGVIWSVGNVSAIITVDILGQGVGYSIVQSQLLVAGLWGVFWYKEIRGYRVVTSWFLFACVTVAGFLLLAQEHIEDAKG
jgi:glucose uptake protein GlcU